MPRRDDEPIAVGVTCSADGRQVALRGGVRSGTGTVIAILMAAIGIGLLFTIFSPRPEAIPPAAPAVLMAASAVLAAWVGLQRLSRERLFLGDEEVIYEKLLGNACWRRRRTRRDQIDLRMQTRGSGRGVMVTAAGQTWRIGQALDARAIESLYGWLDARLSFRSNPVSR